MDRKPVFSCRLEGNLHTIQSAENLPEERVSLIAEILPDGRVFLKIDNQLVGEGKLPGLFNSHPQDPLEVGNDSQSTVVSYVANSYFKGKINQAKLKLE